MRLLGYSGEPESGAPQLRLASRFEFLTVRRVRYRVQWISRDMSDPSDISPPSQDGDNSQSSTRKKGRRETRLTELSINHDANKQLPIRFDMHTGFYSRYIYGALSDKNLYKQFQFLDEET
ncbi:hypothetical protein VNO80_22607 [Phaseolus coccineus]|uniref:Uncharacterized protein n=1 Tax=Phaseolus coccineus TaxID=3886 RepID=A0AAN9MA56_PHACN